MNPKYISIKRAICTGLCFIGVLSVTASQPQTTNSNNGLAIAYWGTLTSNPGIKLGLEKTYLKASKYTITGSASLILNRKTDIYTSAGILMGNSLRKTGKSGLYFEHGLNYGYLGSYYDFDLYRTNTDQQIVNVGRKWVSSIILGYSLGVGYDFSKRTDANWQLFMKPGIYYRFPNNDNLFYLNNYSIEMGFTMHPQWLNKTK
jgi:hypothetical protein